MRFLADFAKNPAVTLEVALRLDDLFRLCFWEASYFAGKGTKEHFLVQRQTDLRPVQRVFLGQEGNLDGASAIGGFSMW